MLIYLQPTANDEQITLLFFFSWSFCIQHSHSERQREEVCEKEKEKDRTLLSRTIPMAKFVFPVPERNLRQIRRNFFASASIAFYFFMAVFFFITKCLHFIKIKKSTLKMQVMYAEFKFQVM